MQNLDLLLKARMVGPRAKPPNAKFWARISTSVKAVKHPPTLLGQEVQRLHTLIRVTVSTPKPSLGQLALTKPLRVPCVHVEVCKICIHERLVVFSIERLKPKRNHSVAVPSITVGVAVDFFAVRCELVFEARDLPLPSNVLVFERHQGVVSLNRNTEPRKGLVCLWSTELELTMPKLNHAVLSSRFQSWPVGRQAQRLILRTAEILSKVHLVVICAWHGAKGRHVNLLQSAKVRDRVAKLSSAEVEVALLIPSGLGRERRNERP